MKSASTRRAISFVVLLGVVSLFADVTYEGARSVTGPYLEVLGASATAVGLIAGFGELIGYALRLVSGMVTERTGRYWAITLLGYLINLLAVPLMGFAQRWEWVAGLMFLERLGKAIRTPARDAMLSHATSRTGHGWGFGLHEFLDQMGAVSGPLAVAWTLQRTGNQYPVAFRMLAVSAVAALLVLFVSVWLYPNPRQLEVKTLNLHGQGLARRYWRYVVAAALVAAGYADFPLIAFHLQRTKVEPSSSIALLYSLAMASDAVSALVFGKLFDKRGLAVLAAAVILSAGFAPLVFWGGPAYAVCGVALWGIGMGAQESILRAGIATLAPPERRASSYGVFNTIYGFAWFAGSAAMGALYDHSLPALIAFSVLSQLMAVGVLFTVS